jgi:hypothetical protein
VTKEGKSSALVGWLRPPGLANQPKPPPITASSITTRAILPNLLSANSPTHISAPSATGHTSMPLALVPATPSSSPAPVPTTQDIRRPGQWRHGLSADKVAWIESLIALWPLDLAAWERELRGDSDRNFLLYLVEHALSSTDSNTSLEPFRCRNYKSAYSAFDHVTAALAPDLLHQRIFRPYPSDSSSFVHALGAVPKTATTVRVIHDHSRPHDR